MYSLMICCQTLVGTASYNSWLPLRCHPQSKSKLTLQAVYSLLSLPCPHLHVGLNPVPDLVLQFLLCAEMSCNRHVDWRAYIRHTMLQLSLAVKTSVLLFQEY
jgi:hypothetical protein